jgi:predicted nucleotidyltransferase
MIYSTNTAIPIPYQNVASFCQQNHIIRLWLFGSILNEHFTAQSDVDVLVEFAISHIPGWEIVTMQEQLGQILGRDVALAMPDALPVSIADDVLKQATLIYERA